MSGYGVDTSTLLLTIALPDGSAVVVIGENDGVNGYEWAANLIREGEGSPLNVEVTEDVLIDGVTPAGSCPCGEDGCDGFAWPMASDSDFEHPYVERCDSGDVFADDDEAARHVAQQDPGRLVVHHMLYGNVQRRRWQPAVYPDPRPNEEL